MINRFGRQSVLKLETQFKEGKTRLKDSFFTPPFKVAKPFYEESDSKMNLCIMNASAGILEGDSYRIEINLGENSNVELTAQSYTKIHKMNYGYAEQSIVANLDKGAVLKFMPQPTIPFSGSRFINRTLVNMQEGSKLIFSDILSCGRIKMGEEFGFESFKSRTQVLCKGKTVFLDNMMLTPGLQDLNGMGFYEGFTHQASIFIFGDAIQEDVYEGLGGILSGQCEIEYGITKTFNNGMLLRVLGRHAEQLKSIQFEVGRFIGW